MSMSGDWIKVGSCLPQGNIEYSNFSVAMCVYGGDDPEWFRSAVKSVLNQTVPPDEVVLVVDGPVPEHLDCVIRECERRTEFKVIRLTENQGHGNARRTSLQHCSNELVALMDADDISVPNRFELQLKHWMEHPETDIVGGNISEFIKETANVVGYRVVPSDHEEMISYMKKRCPFNQVTVMFRKTAVQDAGGYLDWFWNEDYYLWVRMYIAGKRFANIPQVLVNVRVGEEMYQRRGGLRYFKSEAKLQKYMLDHGVIGLTTYVVNVVKRLIIQVVLPNRVRGWVFQKFARSTTNE